MELIVFGLIPVIILILANGFFSGSELAIISAPRSRIARLIQEGNPRARVVDQLQKDPHRFLATVQIGVTVVGSMASVIGGAAAIEYLRPLLAASTSPLVHRFAEPLSLALAVALVSYLSLILGELSPKTIGLKYADRVSLLVARPIDLLSRIAVIPIRFLTASNKVVLAALGIKPEVGTAFITRDEVLHVVAEGGEAGALSELEQKVIRNMLDFSRTAVREVMTPRPRMVALNVDVPRTELLETLQENMYSRYPIYSGTLENIIGFIHSKDLLPLLNEPGLSIRSVLRPPLFVPEGKGAADLLREMQRRKIHLAIVVDEYGGLSGLVTTEDLLEELVGEIEDEHDVGELRRAERQPDGTLLVDGLISVSDLKELLDVRIEEPVQADTLAGLILSRLGRFPEQNEQVEWHGFILTCTEVTTTAILRVRIGRSDQRM